MPLHARALPTVLILLPPALVCAQTTPEEWFASGRAAVKAAAEVEPIEHRAKNVILFVGDGMGVSTVTAARILEGQQRGQPGEENLLSFERLPHTALVKTYTTNAQVSDSAGTMSAMMTGVKTKSGVIAVDQNVTRGDHTTAPGHEMTTLVERCERRGMATGIVTTTAVTHATPAACYAHSVERNWESDADLAAAAREAGYRDIARQLLEFPHGDGIEVVLGGGRQHFLPADAADPEWPERTGARRDGRHLIREWLRRPDAVYVWNREGFDSLDPAAIGPVLGLFQPGHMQYEADRSDDRAGEPSLSAMTVRAIEILSRGDRGFFLMVEGGRIDHAHHDNNASRALTDTIEFARAVAAALRQVDLSQTLVIVTADHSHPMTVSGYATRGNPILGAVRLNDGRGRPAESQAEDAHGRPYTAITYAHGSAWSCAACVGFRAPDNGENAGGGGEGDGPCAPCVRRDLGTVDTADRDFRFETAIPLADGTHAGEDVPVYAGGPKAHLLRGVIEQHVIYHVMAEALGMTDGEASN